MSSPSRSGFTLMEIMAVMIIIALLATLLVPVFASIRARTDKVNCVANLRSLYIAAATYTEDQKHWPQIPYSAGDQGQQHAKDWIAALKPYGVEEKSWVCATIQREMEDKDLTDPNTVRIDYLATPFDPAPRTPYKWTTQPWFIEKGDAHGEGNLMVFSDGLIEPMRKSTRVPQF